MIDHVYCVTQQRIRAHPSQSYEQGQLDTAMPKREKSVPVPEDGDAEVTTSTREHHVQEHAPRKPGKQSLRDLPTSKRYFWAASWEEQWNLSITDRRPHGTTMRLMSKNESTAMALNEIAVEKGRGFFYHLRNKEYWKKAPNIEACPSSRVPVQPG